MSTTPYKSYGRLGRVFVIVCVIGSVISYIDDDKGWDTLLWLGGWWSVIMFLDYLRDRGVWSDVDEDP